MHPSPPYCVGPRTDFTHRPVAASHTDTRFSQCVCSATQTRPSASTSTPAGSSRSSSSHGPIFLLPFLPMRFTSRPSAVYAATWCVAPPSPTQMSPSPPTARPSGSSNFLRKSVSTA